MFRKLVSFLLGITLLLSVCPSVFAIEGEEVVVQNEEVLAESLRKNHSNVIPNEDVIVLDDINEVEVKKEVTEEDIELILSEKKYRVEEFKFNIQSDLKNLRRPKEKLEYDGKLEITGSIHYPEVQKYDKVFFFIHGRMRYNPFAHHGFDYVIERLNYEGYRVISLNISSIYHSPEDIDGEINAVVSAVNKTLKYIKSEKKDFGNIKNLSFVGHSRAGFHVFKISEDLIKKNYQIESILSIAPYVMDWDNISFPDIETTIIVPEFDGDVDDLDGYKLYDEGVKLQRKSVLRCIYLYGGNHNFFSTEMQNDDTEYLKLLDIYNKYRLGRTEQENFLKEFILRFMTNEENYDIILKAAHNCREYSSDFKRQSLKNVEVLSNNAMLNRIYVEEDDMVVSDYSWFLEPGFESNYYDIMTFYDEKSSIKFDFLNGNYSDLMLELAIDSTKTNSKDIKVEVIVEYSNKVKDIFTFTPYAVEGELIKVDDFEVYWSRAIPLEQFFFDINESCPIDTITLQCSQNAQIILGDFFMRVA